jgi:hypothetical protein
MSDATHAAPAPQDENQLILERREKLNAIRQDLVSYEVAQEYLEQLDSQMGEQKV